MSKKKVRLIIETLEDRNVMSVWGMTWAQADHLTVSFVPDGTDVDGQQSTLFQTLGRQESSANWQSEILRALQTWAVNANINLTVVPDGGQPLGTPGLLQGDDRFGDIRIAAAPMGSDPLNQQHLAVGSPYSPLAGTRSGDIVFNSNQLFGGSDHDIFTVALHEAGHTFGFPDQSTDPTSANYVGYLGTRAGLSAGDIAALQSLYGSGRTADDYEGMFGNDTIDVAAPIGQPNIAGDVTTTSDVDYYQYVVPSYANSNITVTVQTSGISLLKPRLSVYDADQQLVATSSAADPVNGNVSINLTGVVPGAVYYFKVESASSDVFGVGAYRLKVDSGEVSQAEIGAIDVMFDGSVATADNNGQSVDTATALDQSAYAVDGEFNYAISATIDSADDSHYYSVVTPEGDSTQALLFTVTGKAEDGSVLNPNIAVYDANGQLVDAQVLSNDAGSYVIQVNNPDAGATYFVEVRPDAAAAGDNMTGTYVMGASFRQTPIVLETLLDSALEDSNNGQVYALQSTEVQVYHFVLTVDTQDPSANPTAPVAVRMNVYDENGDIVLTLDAREGETVSVNITLNSATYFARFFGATESGDLMPPVSYKLIGTDLTNPMDPVPVNPLDPSIPKAPVSTPPTIIVTNVPTPTVLPPIDPTSNPWMPPPTTFIGTPPPTTSPEAPPEAPPPPPPEEAPTEAPPPVPLAPPPGVPLE